MRKLLSANFRCMKKTPLFWLLIGLCFSFGVIAYGLAAYNIHNLGIGWMEFNAHAYFYMQMLYIGAVSAVFASFFIGTEYADGTIRNKLAVGHSRESLYLSFGISVFSMALAASLAYLLAVLLVGIPFAGTASITHVELQPWRLGCCLLVIVAYSAIFTFLAMLDPQKARSVLVSLLTAGVLILAGMLVYGRLSEPEFTTQAWVQADGTYLLKDGLPNSKYVEGAVRTLLEWVNALIPSGSILVCLDRNYALDWRNPACMILEIIVITAAGISLFRKKDIR